MVSTCSRASIAGQEAFRRELQDLQKRVLKHMQEPAATMIPPNVVEGACRRLQGGKPCRSTSPERR